MHIKANIGRVWVFREKTVDYVEGSQITRYRGRPRKLLEKLLRKM